MALPEPTRQITVEIAIPYEEMAALEFAATRIVGPRAFTVLHAPVDPTGRPIPGGEPTLELNLSGPDNLDAARSAAASMYALIREEAHLPHAAARTTGVYYVSGSWPRAEEFRDDAYDMLDQNRYDLAVIAAQAAIELDVRTAIESASSMVTEPLARVAAGLPRSYSLMDPIGQQVFEAALGERPTTFADWRDYRDHVQRRNNIVHRGGSATRADADTAIRISEDIRDYVQRLADSVGLSK